MNSTTALLLFVPALFVLAACSEPGRLNLPTTPTTAIPAAVTGAAPTATPITVGQVVRGTVALSDISCETFPGFVEPCVRFAIVPPISGTLWVLMTSTGPNELGLRVGQEVTGYTINRVERVAQVLAGNTYAISVSLHYAAQGSSQAFELLTGIEH